MHEADQSFRCGGAQEQMDMVGHEAIMMEVGIVSGECCRAEAKVEQVVIFFPEDPLAVIPPRGDVVETGFAPSSRFTAHELPRQPVPSEPGTVQDMHHCKT